MRENIMGFLAEKERMAARKQLLDFAPALGTPLSESTIRWRKPLIVGSRRVGIPRTAGQAAVFPPGSGRVVSTTGQETIQAEAELVDVNLDYWTTFKRFLVVGLGLAVGFAVISVIYVGIKKAL